LVTLELQVNQEVLLGDQEALVLPYFSLIMKEVREVLYLSLVIKEVKEVLYLILVVKEVKVDL
jgi:hypothetical protein